MRIAQHIPHIADDRKPKQHYNVVICTTGLYYFLPFVQALSATIKHLTQNNISVHVVAEASPDIHNLRGIILNGGVYGNGGYREFDNDDEYLSNWRAFDNEFTYDQIVWIDNDVYWLIEDFMALINRPEDVVGGLYIGGDAESLVVRFHPGSTTSIKNIDILRRKSNNGLVEVFSVGMGFLKVRHGVIEEMKRPIFFHQDYKWKMPNGQIIEGKMSTEDTSFCERVRETGRKVFADTNIVVGHFKRIGLDTYGNTPNTKDS